MDCNRSCLVVVLFILCSCSLNQCQDRTVLFKINLRSLTKFNFTAIRYSVVNFFQRIENRLNATYRFLRYNGSLDPLCGAYNDECNATAPCCPNFECLPSLNVSNMYYCTERNGTSSEEVGNRIRSLYTDGSDSHEWTNSWAFESRSALAKEEEVYKEEKEWKEKNVLDSKEEALWKRLLNEVVKRGKEQFDKLQRTKKLNYIKKMLKEKFAKRLASKPTKHYNSEEESNKQGNENNNEVTTESTVNIKINKQAKDSLKGKAQESKDNEIKSEENLSGVLRSAENLVKRRKKKQKHREQLINNEIQTQEKPSGSNDISWNEEELQKEIEKLKALKEERNANKMSTEYDRIRQDEMNDLIKKQVALILDEERKLEGLMKLEELKKLEDNLKKRG